MLDLKDKASCCGCAACAQACPQECIQMVADGEGFIYPSISIDLCVNCGLCEKVCPVTHAKAEIGGTPRVYAAYNKNEKKRLDSSSGGIFSILAEQVLKEGGVVFGAAMSEDCCSVHHIAVDSLEGLKFLIGSKYLQSEIGSSYLQAKLYLEASRKVLFSGTPCEIEGLKAFLGKDYVNLLCVDMICHGVPSPQIWEKYVHYREKRAGATVCRTFFKYKKYGWKRCAVLFEFDNGTTYVQSHLRDPFMRMFLQNLCLRPSCYSCAFKKKNRISDITLADFWGCQAVCPELDDNKGLSAVLLHSPKSINAFEDIKNGIVSIPVELEPVLRGNLSLIRSCAKPPNRDEFMSHIDVLSIDKLTRKYVKRTSIMIILIEAIKSKMPPKLRQFLKRLKNRCYGCSS